LAIAVVNEVKASDIFVLTSLTTAIAKNNFSPDSTDPLEFLYMTAYF
jgi:hypothetical protein